MKLSIIVPVYNVEKFLRECIDSILGQAMTEFELILVDDGSTDGSGQICRDYAQKDGRIRVIQKENGGLSSARNAGLSAASGEYIGFVDSDDWVGPSMYKRLYEEAEKTGAQIAACRCREVFKGPASKEETEGEVSVMDREEALKDFFLRRISESVCDKIFRRELWENVRFPEGEINEDTVMVFGAISRCRHLVYLDMAQYYYRKREGSITKSGYSPRFWIVEKHLDLMREEVKERMPQLHLYAGYFFSVHYYCLLLAILKSENSGKYRKDYRFYRRRFTEVFPSFMKWGTGKGKDRILALALRCPGSFCIRHFMRK